MERGKKSKCLNTRFATKDSEYRQICYLDFPTHLRPLTITQGSSFNGCQKIRAKPTGILFLLHTQIVSVCQEIKKQKKRYSHWEQLRHCEQAFKYSRNIWTFIDILAFLPAFPPASSRQYTWLLSL